MKYQSTAKPMTRKTGLALLAILLTTQVGLITWAVASGQSHLLMSMAPIFAICATAYPQIFKALRTNLLQKSFQGRHV